jgi:hypothetical protein
MAMTDSTYATPLTSNLQIDDTLYLKLMGTDWHSSFIEPALVILRTTLDPYGIAVALIETDTATGIYQGRAHVSTASDDAFNHIGANQNDTLFIVSHIDSTKCDTVFIGNIGIREHQTSPVRGDTQPTTIISGPINLSDAREYRIYDITGRIVHSQTLRQGIYFLEIDGAIVSKVVKVR